MSAVLKICNLSCYHNDNVLFSDLNLELNPGQLLLIEGSNGSGKTSLLRTLAGLSQAYTGQIYWRDNAISYDLAAYHTHTLYIGHKLGIKLGLTVAENIKFMTALKQCRKTVELQQMLTDFQLAATQHKPAQQLSAGQQRKLALTRLCLLDATLWLLDEPFATLDQQAIATIQALIIKHTKNQGIVVLTTHQPVNFTNVNLIRLKL